MSIIFFIRLLKLNQLQFQRIFFNYIQIYSLFSKHILNKQCKYYIAELTFNDCITPTLRQPSGTLEIITISAKGTVFPFVHSHFHEMGTHAHTHTHSANKKKTGCSSFMRPDGLLLSFVFSLFFLLLLFLYFAFFANSC